MRNGVGMHMSLTICFKLMKWTLIVSVNLYVIAQYNFLLLPQMGDPSKAAEDTPNLSSKIMWRWWDGIGSMKFLVHPRANLRAHSMSVVTQVWDNLNIAKSAVFLYFRNGGAEYINTRILIVTSIIIVQLLLGLNCAQPIEHNNSHVAWLLTHKLFLSDDPFLSFLHGLFWTNEILGMLPLAYGLAYISVLTMFFIRRLKFIILEKYLFCFFIDELDYIAEKLNQSKSYGLSNTDIEKIIHLLNPTHIHYILCTDQKKGQLGSPHSILLCTKQHFLYRKKKKLSSIFLSCFVFIDELDYIAEKLNHSKSYGLSNTDTEKIIHLLNPTHIHYMDQRLHSKHFLYRKKRSLAVFFLNVEKFIDELDYIAEKLNQRAYQQIHLLNPTHIHYIHFLYRKKRSLANRTYREHYMYRFLHTKSEHLLNPTHIHYIHFLYRKKKLSSIFLLNRTYREHYMYRFLHTKSEHLLNPTHIHYIHFLYRKKKKLSSIFLLFSIYEEQNISSLKSLELQS
ncbi:hypothetical protein ACJX0J_041720, partial [Zea mays]